MKRYFTLLLLLSVLSISGSAYVKRSVVFDFTKPSELTPAINSTEKFTEVYDRVFVEGDINVSFEETQLKTEIVQADGGTYLSLHLNNVIHLQGNDDVLIDSCKFNGISVKGLGVTEADKGSIFLGRWECEGEGVTNVSFKNSSQSSADISSLVVYYRISRDKLKVSSVNPSSDAKTLVSNFSGVTLGFAEDVLIADNAVFEFQKIGADTKIIGNATSNGKNVLVEPSTSLEAGEYLLSVSRGAIMTSDSIYNAEYSHTFTLVAPQNTFNPESMPGGKMDEIPSRMELIFPAVIGNTGKSEDENDISKLSVPIINSKTNEEIAMVSFSISPDDSKTLVMSLTPANPVTATGIYTITIPEKSVFNLKYGLGAEQGELWNGELSMTFQIGEIYTIPEELKDKANKALALVGLGYPAMDADERTALKAMLDKAINEEAGSDKEIAAAIKAFYTSTNVVMPENGKYFTIANKAMDGKLLYLAYKDGAITLTSNENDAAHFKAEAKENGKYAMAIEGKYLHSLTNTNRYIGTSDKNVLDEYVAEYNDLALAKFIAEGVDAELTSGLFSIYGAIGKKDESSADIYTYSLVDTSTGEIDVDINGDIWYNSKASSAFMLAETTAPAPADPETTYTLYPASGETVESLSEIILTIENVSNIAWNSESTITLASEEQTLTLTEVAIDAESSNVARISVSPLDNGTYTLSIPEGTFTYEYEGRQINVPAISATYTIYSDDQFVYDFNGNFFPSLENNTNSVYHPTDLEHFNLTTNTETFINENANRVQLQDYRNGNIVTEGKLYFQSKDISSEDKHLAYFIDGVRIGRVLHDYNNGKARIVRDADNALVDVTYDNKSSVIKEDTIYTYTYSYGVSWNQKLDETNVKDSRYTIVIAEGSYGDKNFGRYSQGDPEIRKSDCHLNKIIQYFCYISSSAIPLGIENVNSENNSEDIIFDLSGRRVKNISQPGIYIKNGKKVVIK